MIWFSKPLRAACYPRCGQPLCLARKRPKNNSHNSVAFDICMVYGLQEISARYGGIDGDWSRGREIEGASKSSSSRTAFQPLTSRSALPWIALLPPDSRGKGAGLRQVRQEMGRAVRFIEKLLEIVGAYAIETYRRKQGHFGGQKQQKSAPFCSILFHVRSRTIVSA